jgi:acyl-CoA dehydrogenase
MGTKTNLALVGAGALAVVLGVPAIRKNTVSRGVMEAMNKLGFLPTISQTERTAIESGTVWVDGDLFSGKPDFKKLLREPYPELTAEEQAFLDGPVEEVCRMTSDWEIHQKKGLPPHIWDYLKKERLFGVIIPKEYGGLGFSALANSAIVAKLGARSQVLGITVMVPNSLGPAELLIHYGTQEQKEYYLPRLAIGDEIPCFALTEPQAGSDAGAITSHGAVFRGDDEQLYLRLNWRKRYITLAAVSTVIGMAFQLRDPDNLLGMGERPGITCALIPSNTPGVELGRRHDALGVPFWNCPTDGHDVVVPVDAIIGGVNGAGKGWRMLMESLAAGRGISLPATATGGAKYAYRVTGAHAAVRRQFGLPIGKFEAVHEPLARIGGMTYVLEAARRYTCGGIDKGAKPAVVTAMMKYYTTEMGRRIVNDGMDVLAGNAISRGPRNALAAGYIGTPIAITVEGANILTRTLMIFGQGAIRCHPWVLKEVEALENSDLDGFDRAFWGHIVHVLSNAARSVGYSVTRGAFASSPVDGPAAPYYKKLAWASASFALLADIALASLGGNLKRRGKLTGRFADIFAWMYLANATLVRFEVEGRRSDDLPFLQWGLDHAFAEIQKGFDGLFENMDVPALSLLMKGPIALWSRINPIGTPPNDVLGSSVAEAMQTPGTLRDRHTDGIHVSEDPNDALGRLERALRLTADSEPIERRLRDAVRAGKIRKASPAKLIEQALAAHVITADEAVRLQEAESARYAAIEVDSFTLEEYGGVDTPENVHPEFSKSGGDGSTSEMADTEKV